MVNRNLIRELDLDEQVWENELNSAIADSSPDDFDWGEGEIVSNEIRVATVIRIDHVKKFVIVDVGHKSEGLIPLDEWEVGEEAEELPNPGDKIKVLVEDLEDPETGVEIRGMLMLSKRKAAKIEAWDNMMKSVKEGEVVSGLVTKKIKGGLLVDIGVHVFLPASQVDVRRPSDIGEYIGQTIQCLVLKIDEARRNIVVSRRAMIESERAEKKTELLGQLQVGQVRTGAIKNLADFGAFIDLGGIDGLLHITDMSWGRINHPSEMVKIDDVLDVMILHIDYEKEKISLGLKQRTPSPWSTIEEKYPISSIVTGTVVNVMSYGAFVKLEEGIEGLVHISEMSWVKRVSHPNEILSVGDTLKVCVLAINKEKQEISLGIKQTLENPWDRVDEKYPLGQVVTGTVRNLTNYGAFIEIEEGIDGLLHISDMSWVRKITHPNEVVQKGHSVECKVLTVDKKSRRIALGLKQMSEDPWDNRIPQQYQPGQLVTGVVTKITNFGVFISLEADLEGLLHISELANHKVETPDEVVKVGDEIEVKVLRVDIDERKIGLSRKRAEWTEEEAAEHDAAEIAASPQTTPQEQLKGGVGDSSGPLFK